MSSNPQELAVDLVAAFIAREVGDPDLMGIMRDQARRLVGEITEAGLLVTPQASSAERDIEKVAQVLRDCKKVVRDERDYETFCAKRVLTTLGETAASDEDLVSAIAESLQDFQVSAGGMLLSLTETERRRIGWTVRGVCRQPLRNMEAG